MKRLFLSVFLVPLACLSYGDTIDDYIRTSMTEDKIPGCSIAIIDPQGKADVRSYGFANLETMTPYTADTVHRIASLSKQFCAYSVLTLEKQGKLSRSDNLLKFFPNGLADWSKISIAQTLGHRSGIPEFTNFQYEKNYTNDEYIKLLSSKPLAEEPGSTYRYNNHGYALLSLTVEKVAGMPYAEFVQKTIFDPVGMKDTHYFEFAEVLPNRSNAYLVKNGKYLNAFTLRPRVFNGSGGILSTMNDMVKYEMALRTQKVLDPDILKTMWTPYGGLASGYGAGWIRRRIEGVDSIIHTGSTFGFTSVFQRDLDNKWSVIIFRNGAGGDLGTWSSKVMQLAKAKG